MIKTHRHNTNFSWLRKKKVSWSEVLWSTHFPFVFCCFFYCYFLMVMKVALLRLKSYVISDKFSSSSWNFLIVFDLVCNLPCYTLFFTRTSKFCLRLAGPNFFHFLGWNVLNLFLYPRLNVAMPQRRMSNWVQ